MHHVKKIVQEAALTEADAVGIDEVYIGNRTNQSVSEVATKQRPGEDMNRGARPGFIAERLLVIVDDVDGEAAKARVKKTLDLSHDTGWTCA